MNKTSILIVELGLLHQQSKKILEENNMDADFLNFDNVNECNPYQYRKFTDKIRNICRRFFFKDYDYLQVLESNHSKHFYQKQFSNFFRQNRKNYDLILLIGLGPYDKETIEKFREKTKNLSVYFWDRLKQNQVKNLRENKKLFDSVYVYDQDDIKQYVDLNLKFLTNFYYTIDVPARTKQNKICYVGNYSSDRLQCIENLLKALPNNFDPILDIKLVDRSKTSPVKIESQNIEVLQNSTSYLDNLKNISESKITLDICPNWQSGLSFRFFEAMNFETKIITNNFTVKNYDFYHPNNIFVTNYENFEGLEEFLQKPYYRIPDNIRLKYRFDNWLNDMLGKNEN